MTPVCILGGGPAGSSAAMAALLEGASVNIIEKSKFPRHKVCGELLSPSTTLALDRLGLSLEGQGAALIRRMKIRIGSAEKTACLEEVAYGLSRHAFDHWMWESARSRGAAVVEKGSPDVVTTGRSSRAPKGGRLFGFKAHFCGPADDAVELYFRGRSYVGINCVEDGITNVCGIAPEEVIRDIDTWLYRDRALRERLGPLRQAWDWIFTGPLEFGRQLTANGAALRAGDALSFVDPFTGSGLLCAVLTGSLAGRCAALRTPVEAYQRQAKELLGKPYNVASLLRKIATTRLASPMLRMSPASLLFRYTRPE